MAKLKIKFFLLGFVLLLSSCVTTKKIKYVQDPGNIIPSYEQVAEPEDYRVQVFDELSIHVFSLDGEMSKLLNFVSNENNYSQETMSSMNNVSESTATPGYVSYTVNENGCIYFPYVGDIKVINKTTREIKAVLVDSLSELVKNLTVDVRLMNSYFSVVRATKAGKYNIPKERLNIFQALALSGDLEDLSDRAKVKIIRQTADGSVVYTFDVRSKDIIDSKFYYIEPNDVIYVQDFNGQFLGLTSFSALFSVISSIVSLGVVFMSLGNVF